MRNTHQVALLFDAKAHSWNRKYRPNGPLAYRIGVFSELLAGAVMPGAAVLDFGGGTGVISSVLSLRGFKMTVCDVSERMILEGKTLHSDQAIEWRVLPKDWKRLPFGSHSFDAIIASSVFEYLDDIDDVLRECARVLAPAGKLIFSVPNPCHLSRKLERCLRPLAKPTLKISSLGRLPKIGSYLSYLCLSSVRLSEADWLEKAACAGLRQVERQGSSIRDQNKSMLYLVFEMSA